jgi:hypothetical protein
MDQSMILVATSHVINSLDKKMKPQLLDVLTPQILETMNDLIVHKKMNGYFATQIESVINTFLETKLRLTKDLTQLSNLPCLAKQNQEIQEPVRVRRGKNKKGNKKKDMVVHVHVHEAPIDQSDDEPVIENEKLDEKTDLSVPDLSVSDLSVSDLSMYIDLDSFQSSAPRFLSSVATATRSSDGSWSDEKVDDWVYGRSRYLKEQEKKGLKISCALVPTIVFVVTNDLFVPGKDEQVVVTQKLNLLKQVLDDVFQSNDDFVQKNLREFTKSLDGSCEALGFESEFNENIFKEFLGLYEIKI